ncbi:hypothetical protein POJ06DRAFT_266985 [Lipomyces tetrasporus]|uniref:Uncharacterized protein n=1 Tax=Lipomyces tetrasporus TaxID=54092 RepID=A0AAD7QVR0_9ASCO|nr:uncharacterized protein POJ06DRAFT_266985 [Lipomyces tetrasporus]KAJ8102380.1 hypothetical protein POJ06DRAFT_266985 [Lipomyces tetrasporus]
MSFHSLPVRLALNENDTNRDHLQDIYEQEKEAQLKLARQGKAKWNEVLASNSESDVKADRGEVNKDPIFKKTQDKIENRRWSRQVQLAISTKAEESSMGMRREDPEEAGNGLSRKSFLQN